MDRVNRPARGACGVANENYAHFGVQQREIANGGFQSRINALNFIVYNSQHFTENDKDG